MVRPSLVHRNDVCGLARLDDMLRTADRVRRVGGDDLDGDEPVEQHADGGEVLFDRSERAVNQSVS